MEIAEIIYEVSVEPSYKINRVDSKRAGNIRQIRVVAASSKSYSEVVNHSGNLNQRYVDHSIDKSKLTCLIHGNFHSSELCKFLNDFGARYDARSTFKERRQEPTSPKMYKKNHDVNAIIQHAVSYILKQDENTKLSAKSEPQEYDNIDSEIDKKDMYVLDKFSLGDSHKQ